MQSEYIDGTLELHPNGNSMFCSYNANRPENRRLTCVNNLEVLPEDCTSAYVIDVMYTLFNTEFKGINHPFKRFEYIEFTKDISENGTRYIVMDTCEAKKTHVPVKFEYFEQLYLELER